MPDNEQWFDIENIAPEAYLDPVTRAPIKGRFVRVFVRIASSLRANTSAVSAMVAFAGGAGNLRADAAVVTP